MKRLRNFRLTAMILCLAVITAHSPQPAFAAPSWPSNITIEAEGGIVMDADSGAVLYGKNMNESYFPASITKILTALIVIENCDLDDVITYSHNAVYNVESGSSSCGIDEGDQLTVRDSLYAMMLKSANEAANGLAEHTAGSIEAFAEMMNEKAASLGCTNSNFSNPSGLNNPDHYTSAYDMALIAKAAFQNEIFTEIDSKLYYDIPPTKRNPEGIRVYPGHKMLKKNTSQYYPGIIGGKTGYTSLAGNTLVTCAERDGMKLIAVVLNGHQTHYTDTKALLDFGFENFQSLPAADCDPTYTNIENDMMIAGLPTTNLSVLTLQRDSHITLPANADISDTASSIRYDLPESAPESAVAQITYEYQGHEIGSMYLMRNEQVSAESKMLAEVPMEASNLADSPDVTSYSDETMSGDTGTIAQESGTSVLSARTMPDNDSETNFKLHVPTGFWIVSGILLGIGAIAGVVIFLKIRIEKTEEAERAERYQRRQKRLQDIGMSSAEFDLLMQEKRNKKE
ncbi:MAG: D-alanyl-D-alanine carboxypeptidase family protein [Brotaphodocola sp.]